MYVIFVNLSFYVEFLIRNKMQEINKRKIAVFSKKSFIVQAPAGSGKTDLLVKRYLYLLSRVNNPEDILVITFTRKAAQELRVRIGNILNDEEILLKFFDIKYLSDNKYLAGIVLENSNKLNWDIKNNLNRLNIKTIDGFCLDSIKRFSSITNCSGEVCVDENTDLLYEKIVDTYLFDFYNGKISNEKEILATKRLLIIFGNNFSFIKSNLIFLLRKRDHIERVFKSFKKNLKKMFEIYLEEINISTINICKKLCPKIIRNFVKNSLIDGLSCTYEFEHIDFKKFDCIKQLLIKEKEVLLKLADVLLTKNNEWRKRPVLKEYKDDLKKILRFINDEDFSDFKSALIDIKYLPDIKYTMVQWQIFDSLIRILPNLIHKIEEYHHKNNLIDYSTALKKTVDLFLKINQLNEINLNIKHILVDEFQDISFNQFCLIKAITKNYSKKNSIFLVGDPTQSIYKFRDSEVGIFIHSKYNKISNKKMHLIVLSNNYRSDYKIINFINYIFKNIFPRTENIARGCVTYNKMKHSSICESSDFNDAVFLCLANDNKSNEGLEIVKILKELENNHELSIAILVRSRSCLEKILPELNKHDINYNAIEIDKISCNSLILDLISLTKALLDFTDKLAWLSFLNSNLCKIDINDIFIISDNLEFKSNIFNSFSNKNLLNKLSKDTKLMINKIKLLFGDYINNINYGKLSSFVYRIWICLGGKELMIDDYSDAIAIFFKILTNFENNSNIIDINEFEKEIDNSFSSKVVETKKSNSNIHIMTMHKAKGLEFDIVIIPGINKIFKRDKNNIMLWSNISNNFNEENILISVSDPEKINYLNNKPIKNNIHSYILRENLIKSKYENIRLLYVAMTRAKKKIYLVSEIKTDLNLCNLNNIKLKDIDKNIFRSDSFLGIMEKYIGNINIKSFNKISNIRDSKVVSNIPHKFIKSSTPNDLEFIGNKNICNEIIDKNSKEKKIGTIIHYLIKKFFIEYQCKIDFEFIKRKKSFFISYLRLNNIKEYEIEFALKYINLTFKNIIRDKKSNWIFFRRYLVEESEFKIIKLDKNKFYENFVVDRILIKDNKLWIVDYKIIFNNESMLIDSFYKYKEQLRNYSKLLSNYYGIYEVYACLYFPLTPFLYKWKINLS